MTQQEKQDIMKEYAVHEGDTGSIIRMTITPEEAF